MCGIFGGISIKDPEAILKVMGDALAHRGPDDKGEYISRTVALGHRRLSIIDLISGHQPMLSADNQQVIVYNGEIYNFKEVKKELINKGHIFRTGSDTEVIIAAYKEWGYECLHKFNGMFSFALWDNNTRKLWLVRDRVGKKPLYFMQLASAFYFASEAKALWKVPGFKKDLDPRAIDQYFTFRYIPGKRTFYKGITRLSAGSWMLVGEDSVICQQKKWWDMPQAREDAGTGSKKRLQDYYEEFHDIFSSAVRLRLISDVPLGLFLSSGIDSASIAMEMAEVSRPTFITIGFGESNDELKAAGLLARQLGGKHSPFLVQEGDFELLDDAITSMDEPYADPIILPTFLLAREASKEVKVILTGDGADEVMGGYVHHEFFRKAPKLPAIAYKMTASFLRLLSPSALNLLFHYPAPLGNSGKKRMLALLDSYPDTLRSYMNFSSLFGEEERDRLYSDAFKASLKEEPDEIKEAMSLHFKREGAEYFDKVLQWDLKTWFPEQTLMKLDRLSMASSIEGRCPYADYRLLDFFLKMPLNHFIKCTDNKMLSRAVYRERVRGVAGSKQAFYFPLHTLFNDKINRIISKVLSKENVERCGFLRYAYINMLLSQRGSSSLLADKQLMSLVILIKWLNHFEGS